MIMAITIRTISVADIDEADAIQAAAYGGGERRALIEMYLRLQPDGWIIASSDGVPAGLAGAVNYGPLAYVGLVSVLPSMQRQGVGQAMMAHLLNWLRQGGDPVVALDATPAGAPLYERLGFVDDGQTIVFMPDDAPAAPRAREYVDPLWAGDIAKLATFDEPIYGAGRAEVFRELLASLPGRAFVARDSAGRLTGYLFAQPKAIGPWSARTPSDAENLLAAALGLEYEQPPRVLAPSINAEVAPLLARYGFSPRRALRHMRLGGDGSAGQRGLLYALTSFAIG
jgi:GNAT superfamily N-acetyltransferase